MENKTAVMWLLQELKKVNYHPTEAMIMYAKKLEKQQMADAFYAPANEAESNNFDEYYTQKYKDEN